MSCSRKGRFATKRGIVELCRLGQQGIISSSTTAAARPLLHGFCLIGKQFISIPRTVLRNDGALDSMMSLEKNYNFVISVRDMILGRSSRSIPVRVLEGKRAELGFEISGRKFLEFVRGHPSVFEPFMDPRWGGGGGGLESFRLTEAVNSLLEEECAILAASEQSSVLKLRKLLMLSPDHTIHMEKIAALKRDFGLPNDLLTQVASKYPEYFRLCDSALELVAWDDTLAISEAERQATNQDRGAIETGEHPSNTLAISKVEKQAENQLENPIIFRMSFLRGIIPSKRALESLSNWQELPYISPYQAPPDSLEYGTPQWEKRIIAVLHEFLSLTIEKKIDIQKIFLLRKDYRIPNKFPLLCYRFPGMFYVCQKGWVKTLILREGYNKGQLVEDHPLVTLKRKYMKLISQKKAMHGSRKIESS